MTYWPSKRSSAHAWAARCCEREAELVGVVAGDAPLVGDALGALELRGHLVLREVRLGDRDAEAELLATVDADRDAAHDLDAAREGDVDDAGADERRRRGWWPAGYEPHCVSTVVAATASGSPAVSHAVRAMLKRLLADLADAAADDLADLGRIDARCGRRWPVWTVASRSAGWTVERPPLRLPDGGADGFDDHDIRCGHTPETNPRRSHPHSPSDE